MRQVVRWTVIFLSIGLLAAGGYWYYRLRAATTGGESGTYTQVVTVQQGSLSSTVTVVGQVEAIQHSQLTFSRMSGSARLQTLEVRAGHVVTAGQVLATIDATPYQQTYEQALSDLRAAEEALATLTAPPTSLQIAQADLAVTKAEVQLRQAQDALEALLHPDIADLEADVAAAESALAKARAELLSRQQDTAAKDQLARLITAEATPTALYNRLAAETYSDAYYQDRLELAYNRMMDAQDSRVTNQLQAQINVRKAERTLAEARAALAEAQAGPDSTPAGALALAKARLAVQEAEVALLEAQQTRTRLDAGPDAAELAAA